MSLLRSAAFLSTIFFATLLLLATSCRTDNTGTEAATLPDVPAELETSSAVPEWSKNASIYEVNVRQMTPEGTFTAFAEHLPRLQRLGVDILWFMPIFPISQAKRKGSMGSYYAVSDYAKVNSEFGTPEEFQAVVDQAHDLGMRVILDFVPNHTGWDHVWITEHPEYYTQDAEGNIIDPLDPETGESWGWTDVADLNFDNAEMRAAMIEDLVYWIDSFQVDGYRMDVAHQVPDQFWAELTPRLREADPEVFMLAEANIPRQLNEEWFAADYGWDFHHILNMIAAGDAAAPDTLKAWLENDRETTRRGFHMQFITNHDENSWNGTVEERMGRGALAFAALVHTFDGMPLIYSGQEAGLDKRLRFFEKDTISFADTSRYAFYTNLNALKERNQALWNGSYGGEPVFIDAAENVLAFYRSRNGDAVVVLINLSDSPRSFTLKDTPLYGNYTDVLNGQTMVVGAENKMELGGYKYLVLERE
ncbi:MAG: alpha-amylase family glycosyl hydrolase [Saprospiraceae bacterium]